MVGGDGNDVSDLAKTVVRLDATARFVGVESIDVWLCKILGTDDDDTLDFGGFALMAFGGPLGGRISGGR